jgi:hypothetical protein
MMIIIIIIIIIIKQFSPEKPRKQKVREVPKSIKVVLCLNFPFVFVADCLKRRIFAYEKNTAD